MSPPGHLGAQLSKLPAAVPMRRGSGSGPEPRSDSDSVTEGPARGCPGTKGDSSKSTRAAAAPGAFDPPMRLADVEALMVPFRLSCLGCSGSVI